MSVGINTAGMAAGSYQSTIAVNSGSQHQAVAVNLTIQAAVPATFALAPAALIVNSLAASTTAISRIIDVANAGTGALTWTAAANAGAAGGWFSVNPASGSSASGNSPSTVTVQFNPAGLAAGQYLGNIAFNSPGLPGASVAVVLNVEALPNLISSVPELDFTGVVGGSFAPQTLPVTTDTGAGVSLTASTIAATSANWLTLSGGGGATPASVPVSVNATGLAAGHYVAYVSVQSNGAQNALLVPVVLDLGSAAAPGTFSASPGGVLLSGPANSSPASTPTQTIALTSETASVSRTAAALASAGGTWLAVSPASGTGNGSVTVTATLAGLQPGSYTGQVAIGASGTSNMETIIPVTLVVTSGTSAVTSVSTLEPIQPAGNFIAPAGLPVALQASVLSPTGTPVTGAIVQVAFSSGDAPVILTDSGGGAYTGVWTPVQTGPVSLVFTGPGSGVTGVVTGIVTASTGAQPAFNQLSGVSAASFTSGMPLSIGSISALFGQNLSSQTMLASTLPLPLTLGDASVTLNGIAAPLFYASSGQINFFVPYELTGQSTATIIVSTPAGVAAVTGVPITPQSPGLFLLDAAGDVAAVHLTGQIVSTAAPASGAEILEIFATGLGPVSDTPSDGAAASSGTQPIDQITPIVTIGGVNAQVLFAGLAPGFAGLYQMNVVVPAGLPAGAATVTLSAGSFFSNGGVIELH